MLPRAMCGRFSRCLEINTVNLELSAETETTDSNSSKAMANSSDVFQAMIVIIWMIIMIIGGLSDIFRESHTPPRLPDHHHRPHSRPRQDLRQSLGNLMSASTLARGNISSIVPSSSRVDGQIFTKIQ